MKIKKVNRYSCDFCKKKTLTSHSMMVHEKHCTMNPDRECRVCALIEAAPVRLKDLMAMLPDATAYNAPLHDDKVHLDLYNQLKAVLPALREAADNCPACIMAALRQSNIPVPMVDEFDFKKEMAEIFSNINDSNRHDGYYF